MPSQLYPFLSRLPLLLGTVALLDLPRTGTPDTRATRLLAAVDGLCAPMLLCHGFFLFRYALPMLGDEKGLLPSLFILPSLVFWSGLAGCFLGVAAAPYRSALSLGLRRLAAA